MWIIVGIDESRVSEMLRQAYDAWNRGDLDAGLALAADDVVWHGPADSPFAGPHCGKAQVRRFAEGMFEMFDRIVRSPQGYEIHGEHVLVEVRSLVRGAGSGAEVEVTLFDVWGVEGGLCTSYAVFGDRESAMDYLVRSQPAAAPTGAS